MEQFGTIHIKLDEMIKKTGISKNMLSHRAEMQRSQINHYCNNARLCTALHCEIGDLLECSPPQKDN